MNLRIVIPSYGRAVELVRYNPFVEHAVIAVDEPQADEYRAAFESFRRRPAELLELPETNGDGALRNACLDAAWTPATDAVWFFDDDVYGVAAVCGFRRELLTTEDAVAAVTRICAAGIEAGTGLCGFGKRSMSSFRCTEPMTVIGEVDPMNMGILDQRLRFDGGLQHYAGCELSLRAVLSYGLVLRDNRLRVEVGPNWAPGGCSKWRTEDIPAAEAVEINAKYGRRGRLPMVGGIRKMDFSAIGAVGP